MIVLLLVEGVDSGKVIADWANMVDDHIHHYPYSHRMRSLHQLFQSDFISKIAVNFFEIAAPISMVAIVDIVHERTDPDCIEPQVLYVLQIIADSCPVTPTVVGESTGTCGSI